MLHKNALVLYKNIPAVITAIADKYTIEYMVPSTKAGKKTEKTEQKVRSKDIKLLSDTNTMSVTQITETAQSLIPQFQLQLDDIYELLSSDEQTATKPVKISEIADLCTHYSGYEAWALYIALTQDSRFAESSVSCDHDIEIASFLLRSPEEATSFAAKATQKKQEAEERTSFIKRVKTRKLKLPEDARLMQEVEAVALGQTEHSKVMKEAGIPETPEKAHQLLLDTGLWDITRNPYPVRWGLSTRSATEGLATPPDEERIRIPGTAYAIDNEWSNDPDDAIAFDGEFLWVHVADPAATVTPDSSIDIAARHRGATLYLPEGAARMLAENALEDYALGLTPVSRALSFRIRLNENGAIDDCAIMKTLISVKRLTYQQADEQCDTPELRPLFRIAEQNIARREKAGAVSITLPEIHLSVNDGIVSIDIPQATKSSEVVREAMLLAGEAAAKFAFKNNIPFPFVSQESPDIPTDMPSGLAGQYRLRRCMRSRNVGIIPSSHAGLGLGMYSQVTSPLRRYGDLAAHQQLRSFLDKRQILNSDTMLEHIAAGDAAAGAAVKAERKSRLHWTLIYLLQNPDWTGEAIAVEKKGKQTVFLIPSIAYETVLTAKTDIKLNETIQVKAGNIHIPELTVTFQQI